MVTPNINQAASSEPRSVPLTWDVTGSINNGEATGPATTSFTFEDFNLSQPKVPVVLSVVDKITLNVTLAFQY
jgi:hypothetical protein